MSSMGVWVVAPLGDADIAATRRRFGESADSYGRPPERSGEMVWWAGTSVSESFFVPSVEHPGRRCDTVSAVRLAELVLGEVCSEAHDELKDALMDLLPDDSERLFCAAASRADPAAAPAYALGAQSMLRMPGYFGDFLLTSGQLQDALSEVETVLAVPVRHRPETIERIMDWMTVIGDDPNHDADELINGPLPVLRNAAMTGFGVVGLTKRC